MSSLESSRRKVWVAVLLAALVALPAVSQEAAEAPSAATMKTAPGSVSWQPLVSFDKLVLTVQGGGFLSTREFVSGEAHFAPVDPEGFQLPDGTYNWEIRMIPPALAFNDSLVRSNERRGGGRSQNFGTAPEPVVQSGSFTIANGAIVDPELTEPESTGGRPGTRTAESTDIDDSDAAHQ